MFDRRLLPGSFLSGPELTQALVALGLRFAAQPSSDEENIEDVLLAASWAGVVEGDLRTLAVLTTWLGTHNEVVNADRLTRVVRGLPLDRLRAYWVGIATWLRREQKDQRWRRLAEAWPGEARVDLVETPEFLLGRKGEDARFAGSPLRAPATVLRDRQSDIDTPSQVAQRHAAYRKRVVMGPRYRSDMWALLEKDPELTAAVLARRTYGSYATAVDVARRRALVAGG